MNIVNVAGRDRKITMLGRAKFVFTTLLFAMLTFLVISFWPANIGSNNADVPDKMVSAPDVEQAVFGLCHIGGGINCVVDGDTIWFGGQKIRIADIDAPETHPAHCANEERLGKAATKRLHILLNDGPFTLERIDRDQDQYGRLLRVVTRNGQSLGATLVDEGLARWYQGGRRSWC